MKEVSRVYNKPRVGMKRSVMTAARPINICRHEYLNFRFKLCDILVVPSQFRIKLFRVLCIRLQCYSVGYLQFHQTHHFTDYVLPTKTKCFVTDEKYPAPFLPTNVYIGTLRTFQCHKVNECKERVAYSSTINLNLETVEVAATVCR